MGLGKGGVSYGGSVEGSRSGEKNPFLPHLQLPPTTPEFPQIPKIKKEKTKDTTDPTLGATVRLGHKRLRTLMKSSSLWYLPGHWLEEVICLVGREGLLVGDGWLGRDRSGVKVHTPPFLPPLLSPP